MEMASLILIALGVAITACLVYFFAYFTVQCWRYRKFRGPFALPLIGCCYSAAPLNLLKYIASMRRRFGKVFVFFGFAKAHLIILDSVVARRILSDSKCFIKGYNYSVTFAHAFGKGLVTSNGEKHRKDRKIFGKYFVRGNILKWTSSINNVANVAIADMMGGPSAGGKVASVNVEHMFAKMALRVFMKFCTGTDYVNDPKKEDWICKLISSGSNAVAECMLLNLPMWNIFPQVQKVAYCRTVMSREFDEQLKQRQRFIAEGKGEDFDDCLSAMINDGMGMEDMLDHFITLVCAGHDTSAFFASYMVYLLASNPEMQDTLRAELMAHFKGNAEAEVTADDITELRYLAKVMQETLRYYSIIPLVSRLAAEEVHIKEANITIPKGSEMLIPMAVINRDPSIWENPSVFNPDRFEGKTTDFTLAKNGFFPFGYGSRVCIGNTLAQIESGIFLCKILMNYRLEADPDFKIRILSGISLTTKGGINVMVRAL
jgi:cytochrome P450